MRYLHRYRLIGRHAVTGLAKHHIRNGDIALRLVVQLQDRHLPSVVGHIKIMVRYPVLNKLCMHGSPAPLQRSIDQDKSMISCVYWSLQQDRWGTPQTHLCSRCCHTCACLIRQKLTMLRCSLLVSMPETCAAHIKRGAEKRGRKPLCALLIGT